PAKYHGRLANDALDQCSHVRHKIDRPVARGRPPRLAMPAEIAGVDVPVLFECWNKLTHGLPVKGHPMQHDQGRATAAAFSEINYDLARVKRFFGQHRSPRMAVYRIAMRKRDGPLSNPCSPPRCPRRRSI